MVRAFKQFTVGTGGTPQPLMRTTTSTAYGPIAYPTGIVGAGALLAISVADNSMFKSGDWGVIGKPSSGQERLQVLSISSTTIVNVLIPFPGGITGKYNSGSFFRLSNLCSYVYIQTTSGNTGGIYVVTQDNMVKATFAFVVELLENVTVGTQPIDYKDPLYGAINGQDTGTYWVDGTTADGYLPSYGAI